MLKKLLLGLAGLAGLALASPSAARDIGGIACQTPPPARCSGASCTPETLGNRGNVVDEKTGRSFFLDYPCDLKPGEKVVLILNIHGAGSIGNWQRHYFPAVDYKDKYRLVVATPTADGSGNIGGGAGPGVRMWMPDKDDAHLRNITELVFEAFGRENIKSFWLAGHSQGGATSHRIVCSDFYRNKVDGLLSLSGGRVGPAPFVAAFGPPGPDGKPPAPRPAGARLGAAGAPACDFSHIFAVGQHEIESLGETSPLAERFGCAPRVRREVVDDQAGHVEDSARKGYPVWGMSARPGKAEVYTYPNCKDGRVVADVVRLDKGHTEGLEPRITEEIVKLMVSAKGGKAQGGG
ncbi:hypothetical protein ACFODL_01270 [Phenylobacterium terrae]|uniref:Alpha/beta hydrolase n=1 Tax=Phenylobacterium terrae TaxID=2665495 RepID=A0ABW4N0Y9_9CAUL